jgi:hypothetical protein
MCRIRVRLHSHIMRGAPHIVTYDDLIAIGAQGELAAYAGDQGGRCYGIMGRSARSHAPQMQALNVELRYQISVSSSCCDCLFLERSTMRLRR